MGLGLRTLAKSFVYLAKTHLTPKNEYLDALLLCHALEKGMGMRNVRRGFGREKCERLLSELEQLAAEKQQNTYEFQEALAVLEAYLDFHEQDGIDVSDLRTRSQCLIAMLDGSTSGGFVIYPRERLLYGTAMDFPSYVCSKRSVRYYAEEDVTESELLEAVDTAKRAPSACNREPWRVYYSLDRSICADVASALPKQGFLSDIPYYCAVTVDRTLFNRTEVFQWFVNGGIFLAYFTLSLHHLGIGSCIFEYNLFSASASNLRTKLGIPTNEDIIAIVGYGKYPDEAKCLCAHRRPSREIAVRVG